MATATSFSDAEVAAAITMYCKSVRGAMGRFMVMILERPNDWIDGKENDDR